MQFSEVDNFGAQIVIRDEVAVGNLATSCALNGEGLATQPLCNSMQFIRDPI